MEDLKVRKLREKLGITAKEEKGASGKAIGSNLRKKVSGGDAGSGGNFISAARS